jgi:twinkle protein
MRQYPSGNRPRMFGLNLITPSPKKVVITEGEYDAMSVFQETGIPSLSLHEGANNLPDNILPYLDNVERIYLWMDNDDVCEMNANKVASKLGAKRYFILSNSDGKL